MILSKKYKEQINKIVMDEEMKKRILNNVLNENSQTKRKKYHVRKIHIQIAAACFLAAICFSAAKNFMQQNRSSPKPISQNTYDKNKDLHSKEQSKNNYNEESNNSVQEHQDLEQHSNTDMNSSKNKFQENNSGNNKLHDVKNSSDKKEENLGNTQANINTKDLENIKNDKDRTQDQVIPNNNGKDNSNDSSPVLGGNPIKEYKTIKEAEEVVKFKINTIKVLTDKFNIDNICVISEKIIQIEYNNGKDTINFRAGKSADDIIGDYSKYEFEKSLKLNDKYIKVKGHTEGKVNLSLWQMGDISYSLSTPNGIEEETISEMIKDSF